MWGEKRIPMKSGQVDDVSLKSTNTQRDASRSNFSIYLFISVCFLVFFFYGISVLYMFTHCLGSDFLTLQNGIRVKSLAASLIFDISHIFLGNEIEFQ